MYVNLEEARLLTQSDAATAADGAAALLNRGARRVLVTNGGAASADGHHTQGILVANPPPVMVARVTGAGDTFMAAHIVAERRGSSRQVALDAALTAAAAYVSGDIGT